MPYRECKSCKNEFKVKQCHIDRGGGKYCSVACRHKGQLKGKVSKCYICEKNVYKSPSKAKHSKSGYFFCSKSCQTLWRNSYFSEEKHPNWTGGLYSYRDRLIRSNKEQICLCCGIKNPKVLSAHHIDHNRKNNKLENLVWVCQNCHYLIHNDTNFEQDLKNKLISS